MKLFQPNLSAISAHGLVPYIQSLGKNIIGCELGICRGHNLRYFLDNLPEIDKIYAIDPWKSYFDGTIVESQDRVDSWKKEALELIDPHQNKVEVIQLDSDSAAEKIQDNYLDYIFIDGDHSYNQVFKDMESYYSKVKTGRIFSGHDHQMPDVEKAVKDFRNKYSIIQPLHFTDQNVWFWYK